MKTLFRQFPPGDEAPHDGILHFEFAVPSQKRDGSPVKIRRSHLIVAAVILLGLIFMTLGVHYLNEPTKYFAHSLRHPQEADSVAGYPIALDGGDEENPEFWTAQFEPNLSQLSPMERFRLPTARHFIEPTGAVAAAHGLVLYTGNPDGYPGKAVLLGHRLPDGRIVQTLSAGLAAIVVRVGDQVAIGEELGSLSGNLYFEIREGSGIDISQAEVAGVTLNSIPSTAPNRLDQESFFKEFPPPTQPDAFTILREKELAERSSLDNLIMDSGSALKLNELLQEDSPQ